MTFLLPPGIKGLIGKNIIKSILNGGCCIVIRSGSRLLSNLSSSVFLVSFSSSTSFSSTSSHWSLRHNWSIYSVCKYCKTSIINPIFWILFYFESTKGIITDRLWKNLSRIWKSKNRTLLGLVLWYRNRWVSFFRCSLGYSIFNYLPI